MILTCYFTVNVRFYAVTALKLGQFVEPPHGAGAVYRIICNVSTYKDSGLVGREVFVSDMKEL